MEYCSATIIIDAYGNCGYDLKMVVKFRMENMVSKLLMPSLLLKLFAKDA